VGAVIAGFVGIPQALGGGNPIEHFLAPSFRVAGAHEPTAEAPSVEAAPADHAEGAADEHASTTVEIGLMLLSVTIAVGGILLARHFYLTRPDIPGRLAARWPGLHRLLYDKYYVDELYDRTAIRGTMSGSRGLFAFDRTVVDGAVNGSGALTQIGAWVSHMIDKYVVDGLVNLVGWSAAEGSFLFRRLQTGLIQNYALMMLIGVFAFLTLYLLAG